MEEELLLKLKEIKKQKHEVIKSGKYEDAFILRDKERMVLSEIKKSIKYKERYDAFIQAKIKDFELISKDKDSRGVIEFFNYVVKNITSDYFEFSKKVFEEVEILNKKYNIEFKRIKIEDTQFLNKWILDNFISFETWFSKEIIL